MQQACHASTAALWQSRDSDTTQRYCAADRLDHMRKVIATPDRVQILLRVMPAHGCV